MVSYSTQARQRGTTHLHNWFYDSLFLLTHDAFIIRVPPHRGRIQEAVQRLRSAAPVKTALATASNRNGSARSRPALVSFGGFRK